MKSAEAFFIVKLLGAAYLTWIGLKVLWQAWHERKLQHQVHSLHHVQETHTVQDHKKNNTWISHAFWEGFLTSVLNPKTALFYLAAFPQFIPIEGGLVTTSFMLVAVHSMLNALWFSGMILLLDRLKGVYLGSKLRLWLKTAMGAIFVAFGAKLMVFKP